MIKHDECGFFGGGKQPKTDCLRVVEDGGSEARSSASISSTRRLIAACRV